ncbi:hypothetical protein QF019_001867 [Pseudomonas frederiksbergensis]|uniref:hypothetical protein n=1 Tax=Pseudomonas frederiksbergensis TaxID=104087 RepID=UPI003D213FB9
MNTQQAKNEKPQTNKSVPFSLQGISKMPLHYNDGKRGTDTSVPPPVDGPSSGDTRPTEWHAQGCVCAHCKRTGSNNWQPGPPGPYEQSVKVSSFGTVNHYSLTTAGDTLRSMMIQAGNDAKQVVGYIQTQNPGNKFEITVFLTYYETDIYDPDAFMIEAGQNYDLLEGRVHFSQNGTSYNLWIKCRKL